ncbi:hypothetical protein NEFER03_0247 [Nematocida sp. LUAm3]|nr:hypothetical protein NEFER03_0247 [Nematocida sp. LUAm3]KAI5173700.1 hypothetical protein NEFER02_0216 [Nematocida sp. LUAm2]KAI5176922.1 hypothetical protein NEFER01_0247 [Nematocida sp. LUAm1]
MEYAAYIQYKEFFFGLLIGVSMVVIIQVSTVFFGLRKIVQKKRHPDTYHKDILKEPSETLCKLLGIATTECTELAWLNISLQRFFYELSRSSTFYEKVKETFVKKLSIAFSSGLLKRVRFKDISFGSEAPYITKIRALSENELEELLEKEEKKETDGKRPAEFNQVYLLMDVSYISNDNCIYIDADLIKGYSIPIMVKLQPFKGQLLLRLPANNYNTRFEICFIQNPGFDFSVEAAFSKNDAVYFSSSVSTILKTLCKYILKMYIYPNWYYYYLPMVVSRAKTITYPYYPIIDKNLDGPMHQVREIQNLFSLDFAIITKKGNIIFRRTKSTINSTGSHLLRAEIEMPQEKMAFAGEMFKNQEKFDPFKDVISAYEETKVIEKYGNSVARIHLIVENKIFEFIRIFADDMIIYQLTDASAPQFIVFKKDIYKIIVIHYTHKSAPFHMSKFRIQKLAKKLEQQEMKIWGSTKLFKFMDFSFKQVEKTKKIFASRKDLEKEKKGESIEKDLSKAQYLTDGYVIDSGSTQESLSEANIIDSHFRSIETKILTEQKTPDYIIPLPYSQATIKESLTLPAIRASLFGSFVIMEESTLTETIKSTSILHSTSGQYVQLLTYHSLEHDMVIQRILLSEEFQNIIIAIRVSNRLAEIFVYGKHQPDIDIFAELLLLISEKNSMLDGVPEEIPKSFTATLENTTGIIISSPEPIRCKVSVESVSFSVAYEVVLIHPFVLIAPLAEQESLLVSIKHKKKSQIFLQKIEKNPRNLVYIEGAIVVQKKDKIKMPIKKGTLFWKTPWASSSSRTEEYFLPDLICGSGYERKHEDGFIFWANTEGKNISCSVSMGSINVNGFLKIQKSPQPVQEEVLLENSEETD